MRPQNILPGSFNGHTVNGQYQRCMLSPMPPYGWLTKTQPPPMYTHLCVSIRKLQPNRASIECERYYIRICCVVRMARFVRMVERVKERKSLLGRCYMYMYYYTYEHTTRAYHHIQYICIMKTPFNANYVEIYECNINFLYIFAWFTSSILGWVIWRTLSHTPLFQMCALTHRPAHRHRFFTEW